MAKHKPKLGQNFLSDEAARLRIADALGDISQKTVIEIGPGMGAITDILAVRAKRLIAVELDDDLAPYLTEKFVGRENVTILHQDILQTPIASLLGDGENADVIGNLPYYITSDILFHLFTASDRLERAVVMMQREVGERVAATPGHREYGLLSATAQLYARIENLFTLPPSAFSPPPEVYSSVLRMTFASRFKELGLHDPAAFDRFLKQSFAQKRKTINNNLRAAGYSTEQLASAWSDDVPSTARAEALSLPKMSDLFHKLQRT